MQATATRLVTGLVVNEDRLADVLASSGGLVFSQRVLLGLVEAGLTREDAYALVQRNAMRTWETGTPLRELLGADADVTAHLDEQALDALFDPSWYLRHIDALMDRVRAL